MARKQRGVTAPECVTEGKGTVTHGDLVTQVGTSQGCLQCGENFVVKKRGQRFCSVNCRVAHFRHVATPKEARVKQAPRKAREPKDGLRCRICGDFVDSREGWRLDCKSCSRIKMSAFHNSDRCTRRGCVICMNAELARSPEFLAEEASP